MTGKNKYNEKDYPLADFTKSGIEDHEKVISSLLTDKSLTEKIKTHLRKILLEELSTLSSGLRSALSTWIKNERGKHVLPPGMDLTLLMGSKKALQTHVKILEEENILLRKKLKTKEQENKLSMESIKSLISQLEKR